MRKALLGFLSVAFVCNILGAAELPTLLFAAGTTKPLTFEAVDVLKRVLSKNKNYLIRGYACPQDGERLRMAEGRAQRVRDLLVSAGFSALQLSPMAYDEDRACKVTVIDKEQIKVKAFAG